MNSLEATDKKNGGHSVTEAAIEMRGITKTFGPFTAVDKLDLTIPTGSLCGFIGPNGAGKTTTIRMIMSIIFPDSGDISVLGKSSAIESKDQIGYLPEERGVYKKMKTIDFLVYMARLKGVDASTARKRAKAWLERVDLGDIGKKKCEELSKGMQQKVQIGATLLHEPELIILDEPFSGLDPVNARMLRDMILDLCKKDGRTIIFSTHVLHQAEQICEHFFMINRGKKVLDATLAEIRSQFNPRTILLRAGPNGFDPHGFDGVREVNFQNGEYELRIEEGHEPIEVMRALLAAAPLHKVELRQPSLDDIFISLVEEAHINEFGELEVAHA